MQAAQRLLSGVDPNHNHHAPSESIGDGKLSWAKEIFDSLPQGGWVVLSNPGGNRDIWAFAAKKGLGKRHLILKLTTYKTLIHPPKTRPWNDYFGFVINAWSGLDVVPRTLSNDELSEASHSSILPSGPNKTDSILQEYVEATPCSKATQIEQLEPHSAQCAMLFAMLVGLSDSREHQTLVSPIGRVWEVDLESLGLRTIANHWLLERPDGPAVKPFYQETREIVARWDLTALDNLLHDLGRNKNNEKELHEHIVSSAHAIQLWLAENPEGTPKQLQESLIGKRSRGSLS